MNQQNNLTLEEITERLCNGVNNLVGFSDKCSPEDTMRELSLDVLDIFDLVFYISMHILSITLKEEEIIANMFEVDTNTIKDIAKHIYDIQQDREQFK